MVNKAFYVPGEYSKYLFGKPKQISVVTDWQLILWKSAF